MPVFFRSGSLGNELTFLIDVSCRIELGSVWPIRFWITVHLPYIRDNDRSFRDEVAVVNIVFGASTWAYKILAPGKTEDSKEHLTVQAEMWAPNEEALLPSHTNKEVEACRQSWVSVSGQLPHRAHLGRVFVHLGIPAWLPTTSS